MTVEIALSQSFGFDEYPQRYFLSPALVVVANSSTSSNLLHSSDVGGICCETAPVAATSSALIVQQRLNEISSRDMFKQRHLCITGSEVNRFHLLRINPTNKDSELIQNSQLEIQQQAGDVGLT